MLRLFLAPKSSAYLHLHTIACEDFESEPLKLALNHCLCVSGTPRKRVSQSQGEGPLAASAMEHSDAGTGDSSGQGTTEHHSRKYVSGSLLQSRPSYEAQSRSSALCEGQQVRISKSHRPKHSCSAVCDTLLSRLPSHEGRLHVSHHAKVVMQLALLQMAEEGAAWEPSSKASITCAVVLPGVVIVATAQPHKLTALTLNQPGSPSARCEG